MTTYSEAELAGLTPDEQEALRADADSAAGADDGEEASSEAAAAADASAAACLLYTSPSRRDRTRSRMPSSA